MNGAGSISLIIWDTDATSLIGKSSTELKDELLLDHEFNSQGSAEEKEFKVITHTGPFVLCRMFRRSDLKQDEHVENSNLDVEQNASLTNHIPKMNCQRESLR
ncbi:hypothetical protein T459_31346 [Capsicum annuum]|uniref:Uncharacterized protein n=1 Tax=Capsicum annuum TaxID=4072 RepID=A0A2G2YBJ2_CAPAN|nr:hypothetical protein T459_31346 [Capsicum annuum]